MGRLRPDSEGRLFVIPHMMKPSETQRVTDELAAIQSTFGDEVATLWTKRVNAWPPDQEFNADDLLNDACAEHAPIFVERMERLGRIPFSISGFHLK